MKKLITITILALSLLTPVAYAESDALLQETPQWSMFINVAGFVILGGAGYFIYSRYSKKKK